MQCTVKNQAGKRLVNEHKRSESRFLLSNRHLMAGFNTERASADEEVQGGKLCRLIIMTKKTIYLQHWLDASFP